MALVTQTERKQKGQETNKNILIVLMSTLLILGVLALYNLGLSPVPKTDQPAKRTPRAPRSGMFLSGGQNTDCNFIVGLPSDVRTSLLEMHPELASCPVSIVK